MVHSKHLTLKGFSKTLVFPGLKSHVNRHVNGAVTLEKYVLHTVSYQVCLFLATLAKFGAVHDS